MVFITPPRGTRGALKQLLVRAMVLIGSVETLIQPYVTIALLNTASSLYIHHAALARIKFREYISIPNVVLYGILRHRFSCSVTLLNPSM